MKDVAGRLEGDCCASGIIDHRKTQRLHGFDWNTGQRRREIEHQFRQRPADCEVPVPFVSFDRDKTRLGACIGERRLEHCSGNRMERKDGTRRLTAELNQQRPERPLRRRCGHGTDLPCVISGSSAKFPGEVFRFLS